jgi:hypothetical protein
MGGLERSSFLAPPTRVCRLSKRFSSRGPSLMLVVLLRDLIPCLSQDQRLTARTVIIWQQLEQTIACEHQRGTRTVLGQSRMDQTTTIWCSGRDLNPGRRIESPAYFRPVCRPVYTTGAVGSGKYVSVKPYSSNHLVRRWTLSFWHRWRFRGGNDIVDPQDHRCDLNC